MGDLRTSAPTASFIMSLISRTPLSKPISRRCSRSPCTKACQTDGFLRLIARPLTKCKTPHARRWTRTDSSRAPAVLPISIAPASPPKHNPSASSWNPPDRPSNRSGAQTTRRTCNPQNRGTRGIRRIGKEPSKPWPAAPDLFNHLPAELFRLGCQSNHGDGVGSISLAEFTEDRIMVVSFGVASCTSCLSLDR